LPAAGSGDSLDERGQAGWPSQPPPGLTHADHHAMVFTNDGTRLYDGNDGAHGARFLSRSTISGTI